MEHGGRVRIRTEEWGMSVSIIDAGQEPEELIDTIGGLCNPDNSLRVDDVTAEFQSGSIQSLPDEFCFCRPSQDAYLSNSVANHHARYSFI